MSDPNVNPNQPETPDTSDDEQPPGTNREEGKFQQSEDEDEYDAEEGEESEDEPDYEEIEVVPNDNDDWKDMDELDNDAKKFYNQEIPSWMSERGKNHIITNPLRKIWDSSPLDTEDRLLFPPKAVGNINTIIMMNENSLNVGQLNDNLILNGYFGYDNLRSRDSENLSAKEVNMINLKRANREMHPIKSRSRINRSLSKIVDTIDTSMPFRRLWRRPGMSKYKKKKNEEKINASTGLSASDRYDERLRSREEAKNKDNKSNKAPIIDDALYRIYGGNYASFYTPMYSVQFAVPGRCFNANVLIFTRSREGTSEKAIAAGVRPYETTVTLGFKNSQIEELFSAASKFLYKDHNHKDKTFTVKRDGKDNQTGPGGVNAPGSVINWVKCTIEGGAQWEETSARYKNTEDPNVSNIDNLKALLERRWRHDYKNTKFEDWDSDKRPAVSATVTLTSTVSSTVLLDDIRATAADLRISIETNPRFFEMHDTMIGKLRGVKVKHNVGLRVKGGEIGYNSKCCLPPLWRTKNDADAHDARITKGAKIRAQKYRANRAKEFKDMANTGVFKRPGGS